MNYYLAIDIGSSSGRHILGNIEEGKMKLLTNIIIKTKIRTSRQING